METEARRLIDERTKELKCIFEQQLNIFTKLLHQRLKRQKRFVWRTLADKKECSKLTKRMEDDSVELAVGENLRLERLFREKQRTLDAILDTVITELKIHGDKVS